SAPPSHTLPLLRQSHVHHRSLRARLHPNAPANHAAITHQDRHLVTRMLLPPLLLPIPSRWLRTDCEPACATPPAQLAATPSNPPAHNPATVRKPAKTPTTPTCAFTLRLCAPVIPTNFATKSP